MTIETDLYDYLDDNTSGVSFAFNLAMSDATPPFVEITMDDHVRTRTTGSTSGVTITNFEIECWHNNAVNAASLATTISALLEDFTGLLNSNTYIFRTRIFNEFSGSDSAAELFFRSFSVSFSHR